MREYLILSITFTAPFILLALLNVLPDLSRLRSVLRALSVLVRVRPCKSVCPRPRRFNPITTERR